MPCPTICEPDITATGSQPGGGVMAGPVSSASRVRVDRSRQAAGSSRSATAQNGEMSDE